MGSCSVILAARNNAAFTRLFFESFAKYTDCPAELIAVDNASTDETAKILRSIPGARVIRNEVNLGVAKAWNQGILASSGGHVCICNNDVVLSPGWLSRLLLELESHPAAGIVCACDNWRIGLRPDLFPELHSIQPVRGLSLAALDAAYGGSFEGFVARFTAKNQGLRLWMGNAACMLIRRELVDDIGLFDESFGLAYFEDIDYFTRALMNDRYNRVYVYCGTYIHHFGGASAGQIATGAVAEAAGERFAAKWRNRDRSRANAIWSNAVIHDL